MYNNGADVLRICTEENISISDLALKNEAALTERSPQEIWQDLKDRCKVMWDACNKTLETPIPSLSGLSGGDANRVNNYNKETKGGLCGQALIKGIAYAMSCFEVNTSMGLIVAAPTAGSCGIVPGAIFAAAQSCDATEEKVLKALATAACIGQIVTRNATVSGAEGGCQAECGTASAMAAAGIVEMLGGSPDQSFEAAGMAFKNVMGLVCDPVAGLVELPCEKRNAIGVANAFLCADISLAGIRSIIPFDEVVDAMYKVGKAMPYTLRETALGGLAATPTGKKIKKNLSSCAACGRC